MASYILAVRPPPFMHVDMLRVVAQSPDIGVLRAQTVFDPNGNAAQTRISALVWVEPHTLVSSYSGQPVLADIYSERE